jgi:protein-tyrosine phosphatase
VSSERRARIAIATAANLRDVGGWSTSDGRQVRSGLVFRSAELSRLHGADLASFAELGIHTVYDLRTAAEMAHQPDALPEGTVSESLDVLADAEHAAPAELQSIFENPGRASEFLTEGQAERYFETAYRAFVTLPSARSAYRRLFEGLASAEAPVLYHCTTGKDRTGWATAVLFRLLGVPEEQLLEDYLLTNTELLPMVQPWMDQFEEGGGDPRLLMPILGVQESYLAAAFAQLEESFGTVEDYLLDGLDLAPATLESLQERLVS